LIQSLLPQLSFSFYRHQPVLADFSGGQITSDAGLLPLRSFDQRHHLTAMGPLCSATGAKTIAFFMLAGLAAATHLSDRGRVRRRQRR